MKNSGSHSSLTAKKFVGDLISVTTVLCSGLSSYNLRVKFYWARVISE